MFSKRNAMVIQNTTQKQELNFPMNILTIWQTLKAGCKTMMKGFEVFLSMSGFGCRQVRGKRHRRRKVLGLLELQHSDAFKWLSQRGVVPIYVFLLNV